MRTFNPKMVATMILASIIFFSCNKHVSPNLNSISSANDDATAISEQEGTFTKLTIKPGLKDGQDAYVSKLIDYASDGNTNLDNVPELVMGKWFLSQYNDSAIERSYIRFDSLSKIPSSASIISATLYLYGESSSLSYPYGNSYYPGSSNPENKCVVRRVTGGTWQESTITWNNKPASTNQDLATIPASTSEYNYNAVLDVTKMVSAMVSSGQNYGFCLQLAHEFIYRAMEFSTSEAADRTLRPKLVVRYR